jgi:hypothetical protein
VDVTLLALQRDRDSSFIEAKAAAGLTYHLGLDWSIGSQVSWQKITPDEGRSTPSARILEVTILTDYAAPAIEASRPRFHLTTEIASSYRKSLVAADAITTGYTSRLLARTEGWYPLTQTITIYQRVAAFQTTSDFVPIPAEQLFEIGGSGSLRGYRERAFLVDQGITAATELQLAAAAGDVVLRFFCDNGWLRRQDTKLGLTGFGLGTSLKTSLGWFRLDLSLGAEKQLDKMLVHFGFDSKL